MPGDIKYKDINNDGIIDINDEVPIGYPTTPEIIYGFGISSSYKNLDLSFFFKAPPDLHSLSMPTELLHLLILVEVQ
ncbi:MAG: hypothetical protein CM15mP129_03300 [Chloroflexota bacterium]|nr:MAG: hypothetical protein CM15mP129_03300 [Chloroflexota bacterium]